MVNTVCLPLFSAQQTITNSLLPWIDASLSCLLMIDVVCLSSPADYSHPQAITDSLLLWGGALVEDAVDLGANQVRDSGLLEMLAAVGVQPAQEWCEVRSRWLCNHLAVACEGTFLVPEV